MHLKRNYRLAFSMQPAEGEEHEGRVVILYVGKRDTRERSRDIWQIVHDLLDTQQGRLKRRHAIGRQEKRR